MEPAATEPRKLHPWTTTTTPPAMETTGAKTEDARRQAPCPSSSPGAVAAVAASLLTATGLGGVALLAWWAVAFRRANAMLWMVPAGLVLLGTPLLAWLSVLASGPEPQPPAAAAAAPC